jgi:hypothetical protein
MTTTDKSVRTDGLALRGIIAPSCVDGRRTRCRSVGTRAAPM